MLHFVLRLAESIGEQKRLPQVSIRHIDGSMGALERNEDLNWLREHSPDLRLLTNAKCFSEGVDVPSLRRLAQRLEAEARGSWNLLSCKLL